MIRSVLRRYLQLVILNLFETGTHVRMFASPATSTGNFSQSVVLFNLCSLFGVNINPIEYMS